MWGEKKPKGHALRQRLKSIAGLRETPGERIKRQPKRDAEHARWNH